MLSAHPLASFAVDAAEISYVAAAVRFGVGVDDFTIETALRDAEPVIIAHDRRSVHNERDDVTISRFSQERDHAFIRAVRSYETV